MSSYHKWKSKKAGESPPLSENLKSGESPPLRENQKKRRIFIRLFLRGNTSPKPKHKNMKNSKDFRKINQGIYGAINFNNMIPVIDEAVDLIDIDNMDDSQYKRLLQNQYRCLKSERKSIENTANRLHDLIFTDNDKLSINDMKIKERCCNLPLLENVVHKYGGKDKGK